MVNYYCLGSSNFDKQNVSKSFVPSLEGSILMVMLRFLLAWFDIGVAHVWRKEYLKLSQNPSCFFVVFISWLHFLLLAVKAYMLLWPTLPWRSWFLEMFLTLNMQELKHKYVSTYLFLLLIGVAGRHKIIQNCTSTS